MAWYPGALGRHQTSPAPTPHPQAHERLEEAKLGSAGQQPGAGAGNPAGPGAAGGAGSTAAELARILQEPHFRFGPPPGSRAGAIGKLGLGWEGTSGALPHVVPPLPPISPVPPGGIRLCGLKGLWYHPLALAWTPFSSQPVPPDAVCAW